jgi:glycosyltransferase involved in cell wall biosynthesis
MKILITTGIYPPKIGGPAQYAKNLKEEFLKMGHSVTVKTFTTEDKLPTGIRHLFFFIKTLPNFLIADKVFTLDTFSVGFPTVLLGSIFGKKVVIRTGGDFLWERYVERTSKKVLLREFYKNEKIFFSFYEKVVFRITKFTLDHSYKVIFSTPWQRDIFVGAYGLDLHKTNIVENYYGAKEQSVDFQDLTFVASARRLIWKNLDILEDSFKILQEYYPEAKLFTENLKYEEFMEKIRKSYVVVLVSIGDISPNMILDAIRLNKPFICTREIGIYDRIKSCGIYVDPLNQGEIVEALKKVMDPEVYNVEKKKIQDFHFTHSWREIAEEFLKTD